MTNYIDEVAPAPYQRPTALTEISGVEYCTVHDGIQIEGNSDDCDQADTNTDECHLVALFHVAPSPDPKEVQP